MSAAYNPLPAEAIELLIGHPDHDWASHTSLLLPFSYRLRPAGPVDSTQPVWGPCDTVEECVGRKPYRSEQKCRQVGGVVSRRERYKYFTADTSRVLFGRSRRFLLHGGESQQRGFRLPRDNKNTERNVDVVFSAPELWLFEFDQSIRDADDRRSGTDDPGDPLACGILRIEFYFAPGQKVYLSDLLKLNERLRYLRAPFHGFDDDGLRLSGCAPHIAFWVDLLRAPLTDNGRHFSLIGGHEAAVLREQWDQKGARTDGWATAEGQHHTPFMHDDDRCFVWTTAIACPPLSKLGPMGGPIAPESFPSWLALLNVERTADASMDPFQAEWTKPRTYMRWAQHGTLFGFTGHSGCVLANTNDFTPVWLHMRTVYLDQARLLLYVRSVVHRFSNRMVQHAVKQRGQVGKDRGSSAQMLGDAEHLLSQLADFTNLYQFPLLSNQQQGLELYALQRRHLDIDELFAEVRGEAEGTHRHLDVLRAKRQAELTNIIQTWGVPIAVAGLVATLLSIGEIGDSLHTWHLPYIGTAVSPGATSLVLTLLSGVITWAVVELRSNKKDHGNALAARFGIGSLRHSILLLLSGLLFVAVVWRSVFDHSAPTPATATPTEASPARPPAPPASAAP